MTKSPADIAAPSPLLVEAIARAMSTKLREDCTDLTGKCYAFVGDKFDYEGLWPAEVDGEFSIDVLALAALTTIREHLTSPEAIERAMVAHRNTATGPLRTAVLAGFLAALEGTEI